MDGPNIAVCENTSDSVFVINTSFTMEDHYFKAALAQACEAFNSMMLEFSYTQKLEPYNPDQHQIHQPQKRPFYG